MAFAIIAGIAAAMPAVITAGAWAAWSWGAFALGAGLSMVSRALAPDLDMSSMQGATLNVREPSAPRKIVYGKTRVGGAIIFVDSTGDDNKLLHLVIAVAGHEIQSFEEVYFGDTLIWSGGSYQGDWASYAELNFHKGNQTAADSNLVSRSPKWGSDNKLLDTAYIYAQLTYDTEEYSGGMPNISTVIKGKKCYNPISNATVWTDNPALCLHDYMTDAKYGLNEAQATINQSYLSDAIQICNQTVALGDSTTEKRFTLNGVIDTSSSRKAIINGMLTAMGGKLVYSGDEYFISPAYYQTPTITIDESVTVGEIQVSTKQSRRQLYNGVKGSFPSKEKNYVVADYPAQISSTFATADGDPIYLDMSLPFTVTNTTAQRLAKIAMLSSRQQTTATIPCNLAALKFKAGDVIMISNVKMGWVQKSFEVLNYTLAPDSDGKIIVNVNVIETSSAIYDWTTSDQEDFLDGGEISLYDGSVTQPPTNLSAVASTQINEDGTAVEQIAVTWTASADVFVERYEVEYSTDNSNFIGSVTDIPSFAISPVIAGQTYYIRVRAVNNLGVKSVYVTTTRAASGDDTAPATPTALAITAGINTATLTWVNPQDLDFSNVEIQRKKGSQAYASIATVSGKRGAAASFTNSGLDNDTQYYYRVRAFDYSGNFSPLTSAVNATTNIAPSNVDGKSTFVAIVYRREASAPSTPTGGSFDFGNNTLTAPTGWYTSIPSGTNPVYASQFLFSIQGDTGTVSGGTWSAPVVTAENGTDGTNGLSTFRFNVYQRATSAPSTPTGGSYDFTNNSITAPSSWYLVPPSGSTPLWVSTATAQISGATGTDSTLAWSAPALMVSNGIDGATGARTANLYLYYALSSTNPPSDPTVTSFNFNTGAISASAYWSKNPPNVTGADKNFWAISVFVKEASFGGTQSYTLGTMFNSFTFNGLVTFTNLNNELADPDSTEITTIDGGLIKTGKVEANRIEIDGVGLDTQIIGGVQTLVIGGGGVTNANIANNTITASRIAANAINNSELNTDAVQTYNLVDSIITPVKIANLAVDTIKIANQAVTLPASSEQGSNVRPTGTTKIDVLSLTWTSTGAETEVLWASDVNIYNGNTTVHMRLELNGTEVQLYGLSSTERIVNFKNVNPNVGSNTIKITAQNNTSVSGDFRPIVFGSALRTLELKK